MFKFLNEQKIWKGEMERAKMDMAELSTISNINHAMYERYSKVKVLFFKHKHHDC